MKAFMEEYGRILVSALVVLVLVASAKGLGSNIQGGIQAAVTGFTEKMETVTEKIETNGSGEAGSEEEALAPGLYKTDGTFVSWEQLTSKEYKTISSFDYIDGEEIPIEGAILNVDENGVLTCTMECPSMNPAVNYSNSYLTGKLVISDEVKSLGKWGFMYCDRLTSVIMPDGILELPHDAFSYCYNLVEITIPKSITKFGSFSFYEVYASRTINYNGTKEEWNNIEFGSDWNGCSEEITVHCTDGDITIPANQ